MHHSVKTHLLPVQVMHWYQVPVLESLARLTSAVLIRCSRWNYGVALASALILVAAAKLAVSSRVFSIM